MRTVIAAALLSMSSFAGSEPGFAAECLLEVDGWKAVQQECRFEPRGGGDFMIGDVLGPLGYFAIVHLNEDRLTAEAWWNEERFANHAHSYLGTLVRDGACWQNERARICAW